MITALLLASLLAAQEPDCADAITQSDMNACAYRDFERADRALNALWPQAIAAARAADAVIDRQFDRQATSEEVLREAQRAWIIFRDAHCTYEGHQARGGTMEPMIYSGCRAGLTDERVRQLRSLAG